MLVMSHESGVLRLVTQADHARIAGTIAEQWGNDGFSPPEARDSAILAANLHDEGWVDPDDAPLLDQQTGRPLNFVSIDLRKHADFYGRAVEVAREKDAYAALLISMHWTGLYKGRWGWQSGLAFEPPPDLRPFLDQVVETQEVEWIGMKGEAWDPSQERSAFESLLWRNYELLQVWDILSLLVCRNDLSQENEDLITAVPSGRTLGKTDLRIRTVGDGQMTVDPYPFATSSFDLSIPVCEIPDRQYPDEATARREMSEAGKKDLICRITKP